MVLHGLPARVTKIRLAEPHGVLTAFRAESALTQISGCRARVPSPQAGASKMLKVRAVIIALLPKILMRAREILTFGYRTGAGRRAPGVARDQSQIYN